jgi:hypothetical protein
MYAKFGIFSRFDNNTNSGPEHYCRGYKLCVTQELHSVLWNPKVHYLILKDPSGPRLIEKFHNNRIFMMIS